MTSLRAFALQIAAVLFAVVAFGVYYDGLERLDDLEAGLWAVAVLLTGVPALIVGSPALGGLSLIVLLLYVARRRGTPDPS